MVGPSPFFPSLDEAALDAKRSLRTAMRQARKAYAASLPAATRALVLRRPPQAVAAMIPAGAAVGVYHATTGEAPSTGWARWLAEQGHAIALPWFADRAAPMRFRHWGNPWDDADLAPAPYAGLQPGADAAEAVPDVLIVPLLAFTERCERLGQGGGHYDRWLADHPGTITIGLGWDCQMVDALPTEAHDIPLHAVVTPTRLFRNES